MPHPNDLPKVPNLGLTGDYPALEDSPLAPIAPSKIVEGPRVYSVTVIMTKGSEINVENALILAGSPEEAKGAGLLRLVGKGYLAQKVDAAVVPRAFLEDILSKIVA